MEVGHNIIFSCGFLRSAFLTTFFFFKVMPVEQLWQGVFPVQAPAVENGGSLVVTSCTAGTLLKLENGTLVPLIETEGNPCGVFVDRTSNDIFLADVARQAILKAERGADNTLQLTQFVDQFEGKPFRGPNHVCIDPDGEIFFTDSGPRGDTGLANPKGSIYRTVQSRQQLVPLCATGLASPSGITISREGIVYAAEMCTNRILRFVQYPKGSFVGTVFVQLSGTMGPIDVAVHPKTGEVYVAMFELSAIASVGTIHVFLPTGEMKGTITVPGGEISGICFDVEGTALYITEQSKNQILRFSPLL